MMSVLFAALLLWSQSTQADASAQAQPPVQTEEAAEMQEAAPAEQAAPDEPAPAAQQQATTQTAAESEPAESPEEEVICRRKLVEGQGFGQRNIARKICKTRAEWSQGSRRRN